MTTQGRSAASVAREVGLSPRAFGARLAGRVRPLTSEIGRLARLLDMPVEDLVGPPPARPTGPALELLTERDRQVYAATHDLGAGPALAPDQVDAYVGEVLGGRWWSDWAADVERVEVDHRPEAGPDEPAWHEASLRPTGVLHILHIPGWAGRPLTVLHELAHVAAQPILWAKPHGPQFLRLWIDLVTDRMGRSTANELRSRLRAAGLGLASRPAVAAGLAKGREEMGRLLGGGGGGR